jgi:serine/threonine-protein kinase
MQEPSLIGLTLAGKFRITGVIGEGGMATVFRAQQDAEPRDVAIKVMNPDLAKDARFVRRFRREAKAASMLKHPNTVSILEFGVDQGYVFLAMECLEGHDLALLLHRERRVSEARAAQILIQVCKALSAAHELSIVHRDLKPDNIMLVKQPKGAELPLPGMSPNDFVKVLDFGIAKILDEDGSDKGNLDPRAEPITAAKSMLTRVGTIVGTPAYMAPEQGRAEQVDGRTDVYACGVLLYELLTGRVPFSGETPMQVVMRHVNEPPDPPSKFIPVQPNLEALILKSLAKWPAQRQQSAADLAAELVALLPALATEKRQPGESAGPSASVVLNPALSAPQASAARPAPATAPQPARPAPPAAPQPPAPPRAQPAPAPIAPKPQNPLEGSTLVMEPQAPAPPKAAAAQGAAPATRPTAAASAQKPVTAAAPAFPTLNIDVPPDVLADIDAKLAASGAAVSGPAPTKPSAPATFQQSGPIEPPVDSDDDVRTLIAREAPGRQSLPSIGGFGEAGARGASIPDLSQPIGALPGLPGIGAAPAAAPGAAQDKSTTLVSALPNETPQASAPGGTSASPSTLKALKGTAKSDPVEIPVGAAPGSPTTKPSNAIGLDQTQLDTASTMASALPTKVDEATKPAPAAPAVAPAPAPKVDAEASVLPVTLAEAPPPPQAAPALDPAPMAVWQPKRRRMNGPVAMIVGIVIGAVLFAIVFAAIFLIKPQ